MGKVIKLPESLEMKKLARIWNRPAVKKALKDVSKMGSKK